MRITTGNSALGPADSNGNPTDVVAMDDFIYSEPTAIPEPSSLALAALARIRWIDDPVPPLKALERRGDSTANLKVAEASDNVVVDHVDSCYSLAMLVFAWECRRIRADLSANVNSRTVNAYLLSSTRFRIRRIKNHRN